MHKAIAPFMLLVVNCSTNQTPPTSQCAEEFCVWQDPHPSTIRATYDPEDTWYATQHLRIATGNKPVDITRIYLQVGEMWGGFQYDAVRIVRTDYASNTDDPRAVGPWHASARRATLNTGQNEELLAWGNHGLYIALRVLDSPIRLRAGAVGKYAIQFAMHPKLNPTCQHPELPPNTFRTAVASLESETGFRNCPPEKGGSCWLYGSYINVTW